MKLLVLGSLLTVSLLPFSAFAQQTLKLSGTLKLNHSTSTLNMNLTKVDSTSDEIDYVGTLSLTDKDGEVSESKSNLILTKKGASWAISSKTQIRVSGGNRLFLDGNVMSELASGQNISLDAEVWLKVHNPHGEVPAVESSRVDAGSADISVQ